MTPTWEGIEWGLALLALYYGLPALLLMVFATALVFRRWAIAGAAALLFIAYVNYGRATLISAYQEHFHQQLGQ
jgi:hypothetical protein